MTLELHGDEGMMQRINSDPLLKNLPTKDRERIKEKTEKKLERESLKAQKKQNKEMKRIEDKIRKKNQMGDI